jgi:hypothetical protein
VVLCGDVDDAHSSTQTEMDRRGTANLFRKDGAHWTIVYEGVVLRLPNTAGMCLLAHLLSHPREQFPATLLAGAPDDVPAGSATSDWARTVVATRIEAAVTRIRAHHPSLGRHLGARIKTGDFCTYIPDAYSAGSWTLR